MISVVSIAVRSVHAVDVGVCDEDAKPLRPAIVPGGVRYGAMKARFERCAFSGWTPARSEVG